MKRANNDEEGFSQWKTSKKIEGVSASAIVDFKGTFLSMSALILFLTPASVASEKLRTGKAKYRKLTNTVDVSQLKQNKGSFDLPASKSFFPVALFPASLHTKITGVSARANKDEADELADQEQKGIEFAQQRLREKSAIYERFIAVSHLVCIPHSYVSELTIGWKLRDESPG